MIRFTSNKDAAASKPADNAKDALSDQPSETTVKAKAGKKLRKAPVDASPDDEGSDTLL